MVKGERSKVGYLVFGIYVLGFRVQGVEFRVEDVGSIV